MIATNHIEHERTPVGLILYGVYLYYASRSLRLASRALGPILQRSHVSIWNWLKMFVLHVHLEMDRAVLADLINEPDSMSLVQAEVLIPHYLRRLERELEKYESREPLVPRS